MLDQNFYLLRDQLRFLSNGHSSSLNDRRWRYGIFSFHMNGSLVRVDPDDFEVREIIDLKKVYHSMRVERWQDYAREFAAEAEADVVETASALEPYRLPARPVDQLKSSLEKKLMHKLGAPGSKRRKLQKMLFSVSGPQKDESSLHHPHQCPIYSLLHHRHDDKNMHVLMIAYASDKAEEEHLIILFSEEKLNVWWDKINKWTLLPKIKIDLCEDESDIYSALYGEDSRRKSVSFDPMTSSSQGSNPAALKSRKMLQRLNNTTNAASANSAVAGSVDAGHLKASSAGGSSALFKEIISDTSLAGYTAETDVQIVAFWSLHARFSALIQEIFYNYNRQLMSDIEDDYENFHLFNEFKARLNERFTSASVLEMLSQRSSLLSVFLDEFFLESAAAAAAASESSSKGLGSVSSVPPVRLRTGASRLHHHQRQFKIIEAVEIQL